MWNSWNKISENCQENVAYFRGEQIKRVCNIRSDGQQH